jgi:hypothetical protein
VEIEKSVFELVIAIVPVPVSVNDPQLAELPTLVPGQLKLVGLIAAFAEPIAPTRSKSKGSTLRQFILNAWANLFIEAPWAKPIYLI